MIPIQFFAWIMMTCFWQYGFKVFTVGTVFIAMLLAFLTVFVIDGCFASNRHKTAAKPNRIDRLDEETLLHMRLYSQRR
jgi:hypothetical protein